MVKLWIWDTKIVFICLQVSIYYKWLILNKRLILTSSTWFPCGSNEKKVDEIIDLEWGNVFHLLTMTDLLQISNFAEMIDFDNFYKDSKKCFVPSRVSVHDWHKIICFFFIHLFIYSFILIKYKVIVLFYFFLRFDCLFLNFFLRLH